MRVPFARSTGEHPTVAKAIRRIDRVSTNEALMWADNAGSSLSRTLSDFRVDGEPLHLEEAEQAAYMLLGCIKSLRARTV